MNDHLDTLDRLGKVARDEVLDDNGLKVVAVLGELGLGHELVKLLLRPDRAADAVAMPEQLQSDVGADEALSERSQTSQHGRLSSPP